MRQRHAPSPFRAIDAVRGIHDEDAHWDVADRSGRVLVRDITLAQLRARLEHGILPNAALVARASGDRWRQIVDVLGGSGARRIGLGPRKWYVTRPGAVVVGPVDTDLVQRGLLVGRVPADSLVCAAGEARWTPIGEVAIFAATLEEARFDSEATSALPALRWSFADDY